MCLGKNLLHILCSCIIHIDDNKFISNKIDYAARSQGR